MLGTAFDRPASNHSVGQHDRDEGYPASISFGGFEVLPNARALLLWGAPIAIGGRAFDLLMTLLGSAGEIVPKGRIMRRVWPTTTVDEGNLRFQMTCLRRILGGESWRIKTVPGRGYIFIATDHHVAEIQQPSAASTIERPPIVVLDGDSASRDHLYQILADGGARVESFATVAAFLAESAILNGSQPADDRPQ